MADISTLLSFGAEGWADEILHGTGITIALAISTLPFGLVLGFFIALAKNSNEPTIRLAANTYTTIFRGLPELLTLFIVFYGGQIALQLFVGLFTETSIEVNAFFAGMIALGVVFSSFSSEVFLSAFRGIPQGQYEGAAALGLSKFKTMRLIIFPQLIRLALPGLSNLWLVLLKDTALVSVIALNDVTRMAWVANRVTKEPFLFFGVACLIYLVLAIISSTGISKIEKWANKGDMKR